MGGTTPSLGHPELDKMEADKLSNNKHELIHHSLLLTVDVM